ncbi:mechanosensitive ion channel family protein [Streptococcus ratti]|uniref:Mechanosensitive ion channel n=1 Tax=Streptococcus ratti FA-1 = DSM 20564 TaxID=699248 RepID=A0ABN0GS15_STRRT|nr:mechanosensitive ion channel family protein [Streptococcus ratti]EJN93204.1 mechanosensitive ion channel [Streptococcus ratti FA-1 = DSM 20564]EMP70116.1 mechanosensitive ion channel protein [Streptococcus ratti FA-1 = DSM 20564]QEY06828.1 mechanosensitive ion channel family protein [Streptococcus ratti]VEI59241.1 mechanosensitive ion channel protein [Streptococcus mutans]
MKFITSYLGNFNFEKMVLEFSSKILSIVLLLVVFAIAKKVINYLFKKTIAKSMFLAKYSQARQKTLVKLFHNLMDYSLYFLLIYWMLAIIGLPVSSLLAGAGIAGVAIGLGAQGFLSDLVNGFFILLERQFDVGDSVKLNAVTGTIAGTVVSVGIRTTQIRDFDGTLHFIPNRSITIVSNLSRGDMRAQIDIPIYADTNLETVTAVINKVNEENVPNYPEIVGIPNLLGATPSAATGQMVFRVDIFVQNGRQNHIYYTFYRIYQEALTAAGIALPTANTMTRPQFQK